MMKLFRNLLLVVVSLFMISSPASAVIKFDPGATGGKITETVSGGTVTSKKQMDQAVTLQTVIAYGKGSMETAMALKAMKDDPMGALKGGALGGAISSVQNTAMGAVGDVTSAAQEGVAGVVGDAIGGGVVGDAVGAANAKTQDAQKLLGLKEQLSAAQGAQSDEIAASQEKMNGKIKLADDNIAKLKTMMAQEPNKKSDYESQIASLENQKSSFTNQLTLQESIVTEKYQAQIEGLNQQMTDLRNAAAAKAGEAAAGKLQSLLGGNDADAAEMNAMIKKNFLGKDEAETSENIALIRTYRALVAMQDTVAAFNASWKTKKTRFDNSEQADKIQEKVPELESATASLAMDTKLKVENIKALLEYTKLMVQNMKMLTANELLELHEWKLNNYEKNVTEFNLDDYIFNKKSLKDKVSGLKDLAQGVQKNGLKGTAASMLGDALDDKTSTAGSSENSGGGTSVVDELRRARAGSGDEGVGTSGPTDGDAVDVDDELARARNSASE